MTGWPHCCTGACECTVKQTVPLRPSPPKRRRGEDQGPTLPLKGSFSIDPVNSWSSVLGYKLCVGRGGASHPDGQIMTFQVRFSYLL